MKCNVGGQRASAFAFDAGAPGLLEAEAEAPCLFEAEKASGPPP
jgi:hypothetical protein